MFIVILVMQRPHALILSQRASFFSPHLHWCANIEQILKRQYYKFQPWVSFPYTYSISSSSASVYHRTHHHISHCSSTSKMHEKARITACSSQEYLHAVLKLSLEAILCLNARSWNQSIRVPTLLHALSQRRRQVEFRGGVDPHLTSTRTGLIAE